MPEGTSTCKHHLPGVCDTSSSAHCNHSTLHGIHSSGVIRAPSLLLQAYLADPIAAARELGLDVGGVEAAEPQQAQPSQLPQPEPAPLQPPAKRPDKLVVKLAIPGGAAKPAGPAAAAGAAAAARPSAAALPAGESEAPGVAAYDLCLHLMSSSQLAPVGHVNNMSSMRRQPTTHLRPADVPSAPLQSPQAPSQRRHRSLAPRSPRCQRPHQ